MNNIEEEIYYYRIREYMCIERAISIYTDVNLWTIIVQLFSRICYHVLYVCYVTDKEDSLW